MAKFNPRQATFFDEFAEGVFLAAPSVPSCGSVAETQQTSSAAAESVKPRSGTDRARVLEFIQAAGKRGATDEEIQNALAINPSTQRPRRIELLEARLIQPGGVRKTASGRNAVVWVLTGVLENGADQG
jgi:transcription initiation factor IIE alpha subunit